MAQMKPGSKVMLHFSVALPGSKTPIFDSRRLHLAPFELRVGKGFVFEPLEETAKTMVVGEQRVVELSSKHTPSFATLASVLRDESEKKELCCENREHGRHQGVCPGLPCDEESENAHDAEHCQDQSHSHEGLGHSHSNGSNHNTAATASPSTCGHKHHQREPSQGKHTHTEGGSCCGAAARKHADLLAVMDKPIVLTVNVLAAEQPGEYEREHWELTLPEKLAAVPGLREQGNSHFRAGNYGAATGRYETALGYLEAIIQSTTVSADLVADAKVLKPVLLSNFCASQLKRGAFVEVIQYTTELLDAEPSHAKNLCRRAQAHTAVGNYDKAQADLERAAGLSNDPLVAQLQSALQLAVENSRAKEKKMFGGIFQK